MTHPHLEAERIDAFLHSLGTALDQSGVYFVRSGPYIKIGTAMNVGRRVAALRSQNSHPVELVAVIKGYRAEERQIHEQFRHLRDHGEWFWAEPELIDFIQNLA